MHERVVAAQDGEIMNTHTHEELTFFFTFHLTSSTAGLK